MPHSPAMDVLVIGGNRFMGVSLVSRLLFAGHRVTLLNRGNLDDPFGALVTRIRVDRGTDAFDRALRNLSFDRVIDFAGFRGAEVARATRVLQGRVGHYLFISSGQVYLVREGRGGEAAREDEYDGPVLPGPPEPRDREDYEYGIGKRNAEDALVDAFAQTGFPSTRIRIPMVNGERDPKRRFDAYLWRLLDGAPLLVPESEARARHVYAGAVAACLAQLVETPPAPGAAYNLAQDETPTVRELIEALAHRVGAEAKVVDVSSAELVRAELSPRACSPFSTRWMSYLDPERAKRELGFAHPPLDKYLDSIVESLLASGLKTPPDGYGQRSAELAHLRRLGHEF